MITGPYGVGKSTILEEVSSLATSLDIPHAAIDVDEVRRIRPKPRGKIRQRLRARNVAALWKAYEAAGATHLALADPDVRSRTELVEWLSEAVPHARPIVFRLRASPDTLIARVTKREGGGPRGGQSWARRHSEKFERRAPDYLLETDGRQARDIGAEIIRLSGWVPRNDLGAMQAAIDSHVTSSTASSRDPRQLLPRALRRD